MKMSCNGCRVLRKGCSDDCIIRPCLQWIPSPDSQANATIFLAKFYGRAGLFNLISAGSDQLRPAIFKSLLYEACGRMVNPVYGSVGLLCSGNWEKCQAAVDSVLTGSMNSVEINESHPEGNISLKCCDIRHVCNSTNSAVSGEARKVKTRNRFKKPDSGPKTELRVGPDAAETEGNRNHKPAQAEREKSFVMNRTGTNPGLTCGSRSGKGGIELELTLKSAH